MSCTKPVPRILWNTRLPTTRSTLGSSTCTDCCRPVVGPSCWSTLLGVCCRPLLGCRSHTASRGEPPRKAALAPDDVRLSCPPSDDIRGSAGLASGVILSRPPSTLLCRLAFGTVSYRSPMLLCLLILKQVRQPSICRACRQKCALSHFSRQLVRLTLGPWMPLCLGT